VKVYSVYPDGGGVWLAHPSGWAVPECLFSEALRGGYPGASVIGRFLRGNLEEEDVDPRVLPWVYSRLARLVGARPDRIAVFRLRVR
jgi:hypothetical protein